MIKQRYIKKKKSFSSKDSNIIPFVKCRVEWVDCISDSSWASDKEFKSMKLANPVNEGWLFSKDKISIKMFASYDKNEDGTITYGDRTMIPASWIVKIIKI
jgi:hypothetical protein